MAGFWVDPADVGAEVLVLRGDEAHHLSRSRRLGPGAEIEVLDGSGGFYRARIESVGRREVVCQILERLPEWGESRVQLTLAPALIKGQRFDYVIEKATEVGVGAVQPLLTERGVVRAGSATKDARWQRLAQAAAKQCGRSRIPAVAPPLDLAAAIEQLAAGHDALLVAATEEPHVELGHSLTAVGQGRIALLVGPEGGWSAAELACMSAAGARPFSWGQRTLRADTASVVLAALVLQRGEELLEEYGT